MVNMRDTRFDVLSSTKLTDEMKEVTSVVVCFPYILSNCISVDVVFCTRVI